MSKKQDIKKEDLDFLKELFGEGAPKKEEVISTPKVHKEKEECPYCGKMYVSVGRHLPYCDLNPENIEKVEPVQVEPVQRKRRVYIEEEVGPNWSPVISELVPLLKNLTSYVKKLNEEPLKVQIVK